MGDDMGPDTSNPVAKNDNDGSWIIELIFAAFVLYFMRRAAPMLAYYDQLDVGAQMWSRADGALEAVIAIIMMWNSTALSLITLAIPLSIFLTRNSEESFSGTGIGFLALGPLGWYIGREFTDAYARNASCQSQSFFGFGCTLNDEPFLSYMLFSLIAVWVAIAVAFAFVGILLQKISEAGSG